MEYFNNALICRNRNYLNELERSKIEILSSLRYSSFAIVKIMKKSIIKWARNKNYAHKYS